MVHKTYYLASCKNQRGNEGLTQKRREAHKICTGSLVVSPTRNCAQPPVEFSELTQGLEKGGECSSSPLTSVDRVPQDWLWYIIHSSSTRPALFAASGRCPGRAPQHTPEEIPHLALLPDHQQGHRVED